jgi:hypothetical protein
VLSHYLSLISCKPLNTCRNRRSVQFRAAEQLELHAKLVSYSTRYVNLSKSVSHYSLLYLPSVDNFAIVRQKAALKHPTLGSNGNDVGLKVTSGRDTWGCHDLIGSTRVVFMRTHAISVDQPGSSAQIPTWSHLVVPLQQS